MPIFFGLTKSFRGLSPTYNAFFGSILSWDKVFKNGCISNLEIFSKTSLIIMVSKYFSILRDKI